MNKEKSLLDIVKEDIEAPIHNLQNDIYNNVEKIASFFNNEILSSNNKERILLNFRRGMEMLIKMPLLITTKSLSTNKIIVVRNDNLLQLIDDRYYSKMQLSSFLDIFKIETNDYKALNIMGEPHIKLVINYILSHYNTTFRKFMNRNEEYYYIYKFFFENGELIKEILGDLNAYHDSLEDEPLYNVEINEVLDKIQVIYNNVEKLFKNFSI